MFGHFSLFLFVVISQIIAHLWEFCEVKVMIIFISILPLCFPFRITYVPAHQVDEYRIRLCLPPLASIPGDSPLSSPTPPHHSPESVSALTRYLGPIRAELAPAGVSSTDKHSASAKFKDTGPNPAVSQTSALFKANYQGPTFTPAPDSR